MEQVFPVGMGTSVTLGKGPSGKGSASGIPREGIVEKVLAPGSFIIAFEDGLKIKARGSESLRVGSRVQVSLPEPKPRGAEVESPDEGSHQTASSEGLQLAAFIPLAFGGKGSNARLEVFVERQAEGGRGQGPPATYFVFTVQTELNGEIQWSVHLKGRQVTLQLFSPMKESQMERLNGLIREIEKSLKKGGFVITTPTQLLTRPFKVPAGFRLNVRG